MKDDNNKKSPEEVVNTPEEPKTLPYQRKYTPEDARATKALIAENKKAYGAAAVGTGVGAGLWGVGKYLLKLPESSVNGEAKRLVSKAFNPSLIKNTGKVLTGVGVGVGAYAGYQHYKNKKKLLDIAKDEEEAKKYEDSKKD